MSLWRKSQDKHDIWFPVKAAKELVNGIHVSRCWTGRVDPVGSTGSQRLSGSGVPTIGGGGPGDEVSRAAPLAREALGRSGLGQMSNPVGNQLATHKRARTRTAPPRAHLRAYVCARSRRPPYL